MKTNDATLLDLLFNGSSAIAAVRHLVTIVMQPFVQWRGDGVLPTYVGTGSYAASPSIPVGVQAGDVMVLFTRGGSAPAGWTVGSAGYFYWRRVEGGESPPSTGDVGIIVAYRGCAATGSPIDVFSVADDPTSGTGITAASVTTTHQNTALLFAAIGAASDPVEASDWVATMGSVSGPATTAAGSGTYDTPIYGSTIGVWSGTKPTAGATGSASASVTAAGANGGGADRRGVLIALLPSFGWDFAGNETWRLTDHGADLTVGGNTFAHGGDGTTSPIPVIGKRKEEAGLSISSVDISLACGTAALLGGQSVQALAIARRFDRAEVLIERLYMTTPGDVSVPAMHLFKGYVGDAKARGTSVEMTVESGVALLNVMLPKKTVTLGCSHNVYRGECGVDPNAHTVSGTFTSAGSTTSSLVTDLTAADGFYDHGIFQITSGALNGLQRAVRRYFHASGKIEPDLDLPSVPENGASFVILPTCDKTLTMCTTRFSNQARHRGCPHVPAPETAL